MQETINGDLLDKDQRTFIDLVKDFKASARAEYLLRYIEKHTLTPLTAPDIYVQIAFCLAEVNATLKLESSMNDLRHFIVQQGLSKLNK